MYSVFLGIQYVGIVVAMIEILYICRQRPSRLQNIMLLLITATLINFVGYLFELQSTTKEMALMSVKVIYCGKPYVLLGILLFMLHYFDIQYPRILAYVLCVIHMGITVLVLSCEKQKLFYSSIDFVQDVFFPHLVFGHGIIYNVYTALIMFYLILILFICIRKYKSATSAIKKKQIIYLLMIPLVSILGLALFLLGITKGYDSTLPACLISVSILLITMVRYNLLDPMNLVRENIMDEFSDGLVVLDSTGTIIYSNSVVQQIFPVLSDKQKGQRKATSVRQKIQQNILQEDNKETAAGVIEMMNNLAGVKEDLHIGDNVYRFSAKKIVHGETYLGTMYVINDITESYLHTIQLEKHRSIAEQANRAKTDFLARMSHEIRTPINGIIGMNEMILRKSKESETRQYAMDIKNSAYSLLSMVNDILDLSKVESGKMEIIPEEYRIADMLNSVINMISVKAKEKNLELRVKVSPSIPSVLYGDELRIRQVLINILNNAVKYTDKGIVMLTVTEQTVRNEVILYFTVSDTGRGIKSEDLSKLFEDFERIDEDKNRAIEGTGLGMSITKQLLGLMEGDIRVESAYGKGSTFSFELAQPVIDETPIGDFQQKKAEAAEDYIYKESFQAPDAQILMVDDNAMNRKVFCALLKDTKVQITDVDSAAACLAEIVKKRYDIIFLDNMMPDMNGEETLREMKQMSDNLCKDTPVVMLTADAVVGAREHYLELGFDDFLSKPILPEKLEEMIQKWLYQSI